MTPKNNPSKQSEIIIVKPLTRSLLQVDEEEEDITLDDSSPGIVHRKNLAFSFQKDPNQINQISQSTKESNQVKTDHEEGVKIERLKSVLKIVNFDCSKHFF